HHMVRHSVVAGVDQRRRHPGKFGEDGRQSPVMAYGLPEVDEGYGYPWMVGEEAHAIKDLTEPAFYPLQKLPRLARCRGIVLAHNRNPSHLVHLVLLA